MKKIFLLLVTAFTLTANAQISVVEPEFVNSYYILTSDSTYSVLPKEVGRIGEHKSKSKKLLGKIGGVANVVSAAGFLGTAVGIQTGSYNVAMGAINTAVVADGVSDVAGATNALTGSVGMDLIFAGGKSPYVANPDALGIRIVVKVEDNSIDPRDIYRIVRFAPHKKERRFQWFEVASGAFDTPESQKGGFVGFEGHKYGESSYLLLVPAHLLTHGEYGIVCMNIATAMAVPIATFSIR